MLMALQSHMGLEMNFWMQNKEEGFVSQFA